MSIFDFLSTRFVSIFFLYLAVFTCRDLPAQSADEKGYLYLSPVPSAPYVSPDTRYILVRFDNIEPQDLVNLDSFVSVNGHNSGLHSGNTKIASDNRTVIFQMSQSFSNNELVTVNLTPEVLPGSPGLEPYSYQFAVNSPMPNSVPENPVNLPSSMTFDQSPGLPDLQPYTPPEDPTAEPGQAGIMPNGVSVPGNFPHIEITTNENPDPAYIFIENLTNGSSSYNIIFDNDGSPIWYCQTPDSRPDMKVQHNGMMTMYSESLHHFIGLNTNYEQVSSYFAVNGYSTDDHELQVLANGNYLLIGIRFHIVDMTQYIINSNPSTLVGETVIQEFTPQGDLIFQWRPWDNYDVADVHFDNPADGNVRFPHMNAIDIDTDGHILVSCRHLSEITKINYDSGRIIWRLSGIPKNNDFTFINDPLNGFRNQHAVRATGNNRYLMFDNGNLHDPQQSRGVEYELDLENMTAAVIWQYPENPTASIYSSKMGNTQRLDNGNTLINWSINNLAKLTEIRPDGTKAYEMNWLDRYQTYRVWRCQWQGIALMPNLIIEPHPDNITLLFNKFGDPDVVHYNIYGGTSSQPTTLMAVSETSLKQLTDLNNGSRYYFRVTAVDSQGVESDYSEEKSIVVNFIEPGQNMVKNGDFTHDTAEWIWNVANGAAAQWNIYNGLSYFDITAPGTQTSDIQLFQNRIKLIQGRQYLLQFDARAAQPRYIEVRAGAIRSSSSDYSQVIPPFLTPVNQHYQYIFRMNDLSDFNARIVFNFGASISDIYLDNISLMEIVPGDFDYNGCVEYEDLSVMVDQWLLQKSSLSADIDRNKMVDFGDFALIAETWLEPCSLPNIILVTERTPRTALVPASNIGRQWTGTSEPYNDSGWYHLGTDITTGPLGIGYDNSPGTPASYIDFIAYNVSSQMYLKRSSCYIRIPFNLATDPSSINQITLNIRYDDGFVAYINGVEFARDNLNESTVVPDWDDSADDQHYDSDAIVLQTFPILRNENQAVFDALIQGTNILSIHGLNMPNDGDFLISPTLTCK